MEKEDLDKKGTNTEYLPIKCRITRPAPPKPATNPLQFVKVGPCPLYKKAKEQIKKVEEVKVVRQEIREEAEDWQHNLDSWKSSRRKRQEHIIERVEEVKKIEQEVQDRGRKRTTFNEILEKRNRGRTKITIPIYDDDSNDLSDYGIGAGNAKIENEKVESLDNSNNVNQGDTNENVSSSISSTNSTSSINSTEIKEFPKTEAIEQEIYKKETSKSYSNYVNNEPADIEQYTYEGAIQNYRSRIKNKININESIFNKTPETTAATKDYSEVQSLLPKGNLYKRKEIFESEKTTVEIQPYESKVSQKLSEDFANTQTLKQRLESLEKCTEQLIKNVDKNEIPVNTISSRLQKFNQITETPKPAAPKKVPLYVPEKSNNIKQDNKNDWSNSKSDYERYSSAEEDIFMDKLNMFNRDLDTLYPKSVSDNCLHDFITSPYPPSSSSTDVVLSSDKEDSGIHTADVSCSVSQSDEALEDIDISTNTIPRCIEKLNQENDAKEDTDTKLNEKDLQHTKIVVSSFLKNETDYSSECHQFLLDMKMQHSPLVEHIEETIKEKEIESATEDIIMENLPSLNDDIFINPPMPNLQPPTQKPPPPPPIDEEPSKQIKKELLIKRSSFLGLPESPTNQIDPNELIEAPPDVNSFLQKEKSLYKNLHDNLDSKLYLNDAPKEPEKNNGIVLEEDEITKKEREIIELVEKEEKSKDFDNKVTPTEYVNPINDYIKSSLYNDLGSKKFDSPYFVDAHFDNLDEQDSEVLKVEHELLQLEREELERQRENMLFHEKNKKIKQNQNSYDNLCGVNYYSDLSYCKSMPDLQQAPVEYANKSMYTHYSPICDNMQYCKSMPDIQHGFNRPMSEYYMQAPPAIGRRHSNQESAFKMPIPEKPLKHLEIEQRGVNMRPHQPELDNSYSVKQPKYMNRQSFPSTASSRLRHSDNWKQPKVNPEVKSYDQHWLFQEAELRRLSEQNLMSRGLPEKDMCDPNKLYKQRLPPKGYCDQKPPMRLPDAYNPKNRPRPYLGHSQTGHALPMSYQSPSRLDDGQDVILSVSGKKKCSYCGNELGRGAAMIIETLGLFYHMECFKCCVCHVELGDGLMGTDVRVRNQKLHCHNCYSSDDGVKFSCV